MSEIDEKIAEKCSFDILINKIITCWNEMKQLSKTSTLLLVSRILVGIFFLSIICIIGLLYTFHNLLKNNPKTSIQPRNKEDSRNYFFISSQYNKGFRDFST